MFEWSKYMQSVEFLESSRMMILNEEFRPLIAKWLGLKKAMRILEVGCGTGLFSFYLSAVTEGCIYTGVDIDETFITTAIQKAVEKTENGNNTFTFIAGDALALPFPDNQFDLVVSHTFLSNVKRPDFALKEMQRVVKPGCMVASMAAQSLDHVPAYPGKYPPPFNSFYAEWAELTQKARSAYEKMISKDMFFKGIKAEQIPRVFADAGFWNICMYSLGNGFSLSNAAMCDSDKVRYIELNYTAELQKFNEYAELENFSGFFTQQESERYRELMKIKKDTLLANVGENTVWEWMGGASLILTGLKPLLFA